MATDSDLDGSGGGTNAASRPSRAPFIDLERPDQEEEEDSFHSTEPGEEDEVEETRDADTAGSTPTGEDAESLRQLELRKALERLDDMCIVLGVDYKKKLLEMGVTSMDELDLDVKRVYDEMDLLQLTIDANYPKLKAIGKELLKEWEVCDTPFRKMIEFGHVISVSDSRTSKDVVDANFLSTTYLKRAQNQLKQLQKERKKAEKSEYDKQKNKLKEMILENHLSWSDVGFDPKKKAVIERYPQETLEIQKKIEKAKELSVGRKELVFRVEVVRQMIQQKKLPLCIIRDSNIHAQDVEGGRTC